MMVDSIASLWELICNSKIRHWIREGAQIGEIENIERQIGFHLPSDYTEFLKYTDGAVLFQTEEMIGTKPGWEYDESLLLFKERLNKQSPPLPPGLIPFHRSGSIHCFRVKQGKHKAEFSVIEWNPVTGQIMAEYVDFLEWLNRYLIPVGEGSS